MNARPAAPNGRTLLVTGPELAPEALSLLRGFDVVFAGSNPGEDHIAALCRAHDPSAIIVRSGGLPAHVMDCAPSLRVIAKHGSGVDTIDLDAAAQRGIAVRSSPGCNAAAVAEHAVGLMLACAKSLVHLHARMTAGHWDKPQHRSLELRGRTLGIVGLGQVGQRVARTAAAMGMTVIACDPGPSDLPFVRRVALCHLLARSDVVSLHCPLTEQTRNMIDAQALACCRPGVLIINTARGALVDDRALVAALNTGHVHSAGLDSFAVEPLPVDHPFRSHPRIVLTPHVGGFSGESYVAMGTAAARHVLEVCGPARRDEVTSR